jgi:hypothetical protein
MMKMLIEGIANTFLWNSSMSPNSKLSSSVYDGQNLTSRKYRLMALGGFMLLLCAVGIWSNQNLHHQIWPIDTDQGHLFIGALVLIYAICVILPFMPAIELGLILLAMLDIQGILMLYLVTVFSLSISYTIGSLVPGQVLKRLFQFLHFYKAADLLCARGECNEKQQINRFLEHAPKRLIPFLLHHRYCVFGVAVNTPGNMLLGGAGGIAMMSGVSRLFNFRTFVLAVMISVLPLPVIVILMKLITN